MFKIIHIPTLTPVKSFLNRECNSYLSFNTKKDALLELEEEEFFINSIDMQIVSSSGYFNSLAPPWLIFTYIPKCEFMVMEDV